MKPQYLFSFASRMHHEDQVRIDMTIKVNDHVPYLCGRFQLTPAEWGVLEAMLMRGPSVFMDANVKVSIDNGPGVIEAIDKSMPGKINP